MSPTCEARELPSAPARIRNLHSIKLLYFSRPDRRDANARADAAADFRRPTRLRGGNVGGASPSSDASDGGADEYWEARSEGWIASIAAFK